MALHREARNITFDRVKFRDAVSITGSDYNAANIDPPPLTHSLKHDKSILALATSSDSIFAGTEGGEILIYDLETYERTHTITPPGPEDLQRSVLALLLSEDEQLLFSSGVDYFVKVWNCNDFSQLYEIHSTYDVGDIFCIAYSSKLNTIYIGAQNASIQWYDLKEKDEKPLDPTRHPYYRHNKFFDSTGPGGIRTPRRDHYDTPPEHRISKKDLQIDRRYIHPFAHNGYVYCMLLVEGIVTDDPEEEVLVSGSGDGTINVWSLLPNQGGRIKELFSLGGNREDREPVYSLALDGTFLISGRSDGEVNIWDLETRQLVRTLKSKVDDVRGLSIGGNYLFTAGANGNVEKFDSQYESAGVFNAASGRILATAFTLSGDCPVYLTGSNEDSINVWDVRDCISYEAASITSNEKLVDKLRAFVAHRTVSSDPRYRAECRRGASFLRSVFKEFGADTNVLTPEDSTLNPVIHAVFRGRPKSTKVGKRILFYGHYDVIPAENDQGKWNTDPFKMEGIDEYLYARGISDNKGPILAAIYAVAELIAEKSLESDITFIIEGEEECGSRGFEKVIRRHKNDIGPIDWILLANSYWLDDHVPCLTYGLRGVIHATLNVASDRPDLHSGVEGSSLIDESLKDLVLLLNSLVGKNGKVKLPGFYDPVLPMTKSEAILYKDITNTLLSRNPTLGDQKILSKNLQQKWRDPSLTIHRFGTSGPENSTIIPRKAWAAISLRLVPNQEADEIATDLEDFLQDEFSKLDTSNKLQVIIDRKAEPWLGDFNNEMYKTLEQGVMRAWYGSHTINGGNNGQHSSNGQNQSLSSSTYDGLPPRRPLYIREGGSIPAIRFLEKEFGAQAAHLPCGQASDHAHLDNERLRLVNLYKSRDVFKWVFRELPKR